MTIKDYQEYPRLFGTPGITPRTLAVFPRREERQSRMGSIERELEHELSETEMVSLRKQLTAFKSSYFMT